MENAEIIKINVGGRIFQTQKSTLLKSPKFEEILKNNPKDENGCVFIDRDGDAFAKVLNLLRTENRLCVDFSVIEEYKYFDLLFGLFPKMGFVCTLNEIKNRKIQDVFSTFKKKVRMGGWTPQQYHSYQRIELESEYDRKGKEFGGVLVFVPHLKTLSKETNYELSLDKCCDLIRKIRVYGAEGAVLKFEGANNFDIPFLPLACGYKAPIKYIPICLSPYTKIKIVAKEKSEPMYVTYETGFMSFEARNIFMKKEYKDKHFSCSFGECQRC